MSFQLMPVQYSLIILIEDAATLEDFKGHRGTRRSGDLQRMTASNGIVHSKIPFGPGQAKGLQLWINLFAKIKIHIHHAHRHNMQFSKQLYATSKKCKLLNWQTKVVAEETLTSIDPTTLVLHIPLGADNWKIWCAVSMEPQAPLWRETSEARTIHQAVVTTVAWHKDFVAIVD